MTFSGFDADAGVGEQRRSSCVQFLLKAQFCRFLHPAQCSKDSKCVPNQRPRQQAASKRWKHLGLNALQLSGPGNIDRRGRLSHTGGPDSVDPVLFDPHATPLNATVKH